MLDGKYEILNKIGQGGMSVVYLAINHKANKTWAVKEIKKEGIENSKITRRSLQVETKLLKKLKHKSLPSIIDVIDFEDSFVIVMDYIEGVTLEEYIETNEYTENDVIDWGLQVCDVLYYLHSQDPPIIYRDMKPSNLMLRPDGTVVLIDFGASREYKEGNLKDTINIGTRGYAAPEQLAKKSDSSFGQTDERTDIYSLGVTMHYLLTKHNPCDPPYEIMPIREYNPKLSPGLETIILKATKNNPNERYQSVPKLVYALRHFTEQDAAFQKKAKRKLMVYIVLLLFFLLSLTGTLVSKAKENHLINQNYDSYVADAVLQENPEGQFLLYEKAIALDPTRAEAYNAIFHYYMEDGVFTKDEDDYIRKLLATTSSNGLTYEEQFSTNTKAYNSFAYEIAMAYWYNYGTINGDEVLYQREYNIALRWFSKISKPEDDDSIAQKEFNNAQIYSQIGSYYSDIGKINRAGDSEIQYSTYLKDLITLFKMDDSNVITRLYLDKEILYQIVEHANDYRAEGMSKDEIMDTVDKVSNEVSDLSASGSNEALFEELVSDIDQYKKTAGNSIDSAFSGEGRNKK